LNDRALDFAYERSETRELRALRDRYQLETKIDRRKPQVEQLAILNDWTRRQWIHGANSPVDFFRFNALEILKQAKAGGEYWCQVASMVFIQGAVAVGFQARLLSLYTNPNLEADHAVAEVWIDDLKKWVVFDTDYNLYYTSTLGMPLNALELHRALIGRRGNDVRTVKGPYRPERIDVEEASAQPVLLPYYRNFCIDIRNDWLTNTYFLGHPKRSDKASICWQDEKGIPFLNLKRVATVERDLYWPLNSVDMRLTVDSVSKRAANLTAYIKTITPNFNRFQITLQNGPEFPYKSSLVTWKLAPGRNALTIRAVNDFGVSGPTSSLAIAWKESKTNNVAFSAETKR